MWVLFEMGNGKCNLEFLAPCGGAKEKRRGAGTEGAAEPNRMLRVTPVLITK